MASRQNVTGFHAERVSEQGRFPTLDIYHYVSYNGRPHLMKLPRVYNGATGIYHDDTKRALRSKNDMVSAVQAVMREF